MLNKPVHKYYLWFNIYTFQGHPEQKENTWLKVTRRWHTHPHSAPCILNGLNWSSSNSHLVWLMILRHSIRVWKVDVTSSILHDTANGCSPTANQMWMICVAYFHLKSNPQILHRKSNISIASRKFLSLSSNIVNPLRHINSQEYELTLCGPSSNRICIFDEFTSSSVCPYIRTYKSGNKNGMTVYISRLPSPYSPTLLTTLTSLMISNNTEGLGPFLNNQKLAPS